MDRLSGVIPHVIGKFEKLFDMAFPEVLYILASLIVLFVGLWIARMVSDLLLGVLKEIKIDDLLSDIKLLPKGGGKDKVSLVEMLVGLIRGSIVLVTLMTSFYVFREVANVNIVMKSFSDIFGLLPELGKAILIFVVAGILTTLMNNVVKLFAAVGGVKDTSMYEKIVTYGIYIYAIILAFGQISYLSGVTTELTRAIAWALGLGIGYSTLPKVKELVDHVLGGKK